MPRGSQSADNEHVARRHAHDGLRRRPQDRPGDIAGPGGADDDQLRCLSARRRDDRGRRLVIRREDVCVSPEPTQELLTAREDLLPLVRARGVEQLLSNDSMRRKSWTGRHKHDSAAGADDFRGSSRGTVGRWRPVVADDNRGERQRSHELPADLVTLAGMDARADVFHL
jgi:hypothetical protein